jgi:predicted HNH restriction endonuclease
LKAPILIEMPLCANCHAMAHRRRDTVTSIEELKEPIEELTRKR